MKTTVSALYDTQTDAVNAVRALTEGGIMRSDISMVASDAAGEYVRYQGQTIPDDIPMDDTIGGAASGALLGGLGGLLIGLAAVAIPGVGPIVAAGPIAAALMGAGVGAATGGIVGALIDLGIDEDHAGYYAEGVRRGGTLVTVHVEENRAGWVTEVLDRYGPVDMEGRVETWHDQGWTAYDPDADPYTVEQIERERLPRERLPY
ncbi:MAG: hypothetical protein KJ069_15015 [Anaerolineae bacterium]|nr:hypothetical protein [Anaerolineae bacterium]